MKARPKVAVKQPWFLGAVSLASARSFWIVLHVGNYSDTEIYFFAGARQQQVVEHILACVQQARASWVEQRQGTSSGDSTREKMHSVSHQVLLRNQ